MFSPQDLAVLLKGAELFNQEKFFDCHEVLEDLWEDLKGDNKTWTQGFIQITVGFYHLRTENEKGCKSQFMKALRKFPQGAPSNFPIPMGDILESIQKIASGSIPFDVSYAVPKMDLNPINTKI